MLVEGGVAMLKEGVAEFEGVVEKFVWLRRVDDEEQHLIQNGVASCFVGEGGVGEDVEEEAIVCFGCEGKASEARANSLWLFT
jgi:hypothetical protein